MKSRELENLGIPRGRPMEAAKVLCVRAAEAGLTRDGIRALLTGALADPASHSAHPLAGEFARACAASDAAAAGFRPRASGPAPWTQWGATSSPSR